MAWSMCTVTLWLVHFAERTGGRLATFTVFNLLANISYTLITVALFYFFPVCLSPWHSDALFATSVRTEGSDLGESAHGCASTVREPSDS